MYEKFFIRRNASIFSFSSALQVATLALLLHFLACIVLYFIMLKEMELRQIKYFKKIHLPKSEFGGFYWCRISADLRELHFNVVV